MDKEKRRVIKYIEKGYTYRKISESTIYSQARISEIAKEYENKHGKIKKELTKETKGNLKKLLKQGKSIIDACMKLGIKQSLAIEYSDKHNLQNSIGKIEIRRGIGSKLTELKEKLKIGSKLKYNNKIYKIIKKYDDYILIERQCKGGKYKECVSYFSLLKGEEIE